MNSTDLKDIHDLAASIQRGLYHMSYALDDLAGDAPPRLRNYLISFSASCELLSDKAAQIEGAAR